MIKGSCESCINNKDGCKADVCMMEWFNNKIVKCENYEKIEFEIKDSRERTEFKTGAVRDMHTGKGRYDLLPWDAIHELAQHCENGAIKYGERNCEKGIPTHSLLDSAVRHLSCYLRGQKEENHLRAAMWNVAMAIEMELNNKDMQDIPNRLKGEK